MIYNILKLFSNSHEETIELGNKLADFFNVGDVLALYGGLGAGKTAFVSGIARGLGLGDYISSPTFTIVNEYKTRIPMYHFDVYRVNDPDELFAIGFDEYFYREGIVIIEWAEYIEDLMPENYLKIIINIREDNPDFREFQLIAHGERYEKLLQDVKKEFGGSYENTCN